MKGTTIISFFMNIIFIYSYTNINYPQSSLSSNTNNAFFNITNLCNCDLTENLCDLNCCCDSECFVNNVTLIIWKNLGLCKTNKLTSTQIYFDLCLNNPNSYSLSDLNTPVRLFTQGLKTGLCVYTNNAPNNISNFIIKNVSNLQEFSNILSEDLNLNSSLINSKDYFQKNPSFSQTIPFYYNLLNLNSTSLNLKETNYIYNYRSYDSINLIYPTLKKISTVTIPIILPYGNCDFSDLARYLKDQDVTCGRKFVMNRDSCLSFNSIMNYDAASFLLVNNSSNAVYPSFRFFSISNDTVAEANNSVSKTVFYDINTNNNNLPLCSNTIRNVEYLFIIKNNTIQGLEIKFFMQNLQMALNENTYISTNFKVKFVNENNFKKSGNPGYLKGKPILSGWAGSFQTYDNTSGINKTILYINQYKKPRVFNGVDKDGACIYTSNRYNFTNPTIQSNPNVSINYDYNYVLDNQLTFEDKIQYGCYESLNLTELQSYCTNNQWMNKYLFQNLNNISYFSKFGNPNASFISDWVNIQKINFLSYTSSWDTNFFKCSVPAILSIDITLVDFGLVNNPQTSIVYVNQRINYLDWFANVAGSDTRNKYYSYVEINFWKIKQTTTLWYAPHPSIFPKLPKNLMAPFKIGTTTYGTSSSNKANLSILLMIIIYILSF